MTLLRHEVTHCLLVLGTLASCTSRELKQLNPCLVSAVAASTLVENIAKVDLLFMVDNSKSMREEQEALRSQFPRLIQALTTGDRNLDTRVDFRPVTDLHLGVVSSSMGIGGIATNDPACRVSDDGILLHTATPGAGPCNAASYPSFLSYRAGDGDPLRTAADFGCIAALGTSGCGFEQQLEAPLKALWPSMDALGNPAAAPPGGAFLSNTGMVSFGHGDRENAGFLRSGDGKDRSLLAIVLVTDEEDCSSANPHHFESSGALGKDDPLLTQPNFHEVNLRCYYNKSNLFPIERYVEGFKSLRPDPNPLVFAAIVGVPEDLVTKDALARVDFARPDQRDAFYDGILADPRMTEAVDEATLHSPEGGNLRTSCNTPSGKAYPPRRIVEVAKQLGENGIVQSICQQDFTPALDAIIALIANKIDSLCLPRPLVRNASGEVSCSMSWELPAPGADTPAGIPTRCDTPGWEFLSPSSKPASAPGRVVCEVAQLPVHGTGSMRSHVATSADGQHAREGWYYDDYSESVAKTCPANARQSIVFSANSAPPTGVVVELECLNEVQTYANHRTDVASNRLEPAIGSPCDEVVRDGETLHGNAACAVHLSNGNIDPTLFCHPELNVCVLGCSTTADCPPAWVCDDRASTLASSGSKICVNPTCGDLK